MPTAQKSLNHVHMKNVILKDHSSGQLLYAIKLHRIQFFVMENVTITSFEENLIETYNSVITLRGQNFFYKNKGGVEIQKKSSLVFDTNSSTKFVGNICTDDENSFTCSVSRILDSAVYVHNGCTILYQNNSAASSITLYKSTINFYGGTEVVFDGNKGENGGAMSFHDSSALYFCQSIAQYCNKFDISIVFRNNHALKFGGAIYVDDISYIDTLHKTLKKTFLHEEDCVVHVPLSFPCEETKNSTITARGIFNVVINFTFINNSADLAGSALYGGWYDLINVIGHRYDFFHFYGQRNDYSIVSSNPVRVCVCFNAAPICNITEYTTHVYKGQTVEIQAVTVGQRFGTVPAVVHAKHIDPLTNGTLNEGQYLQSVFKECTTLKYTILSTEPSEVLLLTTDHTAVPINLIKSMKNENWAQLLVTTFSLQVLFKTCPAGFVINTDMKKCTCHPFLIRNGITVCDIDKESVQKPSQMWINATALQIDENTSSTVIIIHKHCPYDYCTMNADSFVGARDTHACIYEVKPPQWTMCTQ